MNAKFARIHNSDGSCNFIFNVISANGNEHKILDKLQDGEMQEIYFPSKPINEKQGSGYQPKEIVIDSIPPQDGSGVPSKHNNIIEQLTLALSRIEAAEAYIKELEYYLPEIPKGRVLDAMDKYSETVKTIKPARCKSDNDLSDYEY